MAERREGSEAARRRGEARAASLSPEERKAIARSGAIARWSKGVPQAIREANFNIGPIEVSAAVLANGKRLLTQATFLRALGRSRSPKAGTGVLSTVDGLPFFLQAEQLKPFISEELTASTTPIFYVDGSGRRAVGYDALLLPAVAEVYLKLRDESSRLGRPVQPRYEHIVRACDAIIRGLAKVGIVALVDEATGYQDLRAKDALTRLLEKFIADELRRWVKTFPDDFYREMFRLKNWPYPPGSAAKPAIVGRLTNDLVYRRLAPGVLDELKRVSPRDEKGRLKQHYHRRLTEDVGHPKLREHLGAVVALMKISKTWIAFMDRLNQVAPVFNRPYMLDLGTDE